MRAAIHGHSNIVAYLLRLPAVRATVDTTDRQGCTALSHASRPNVVQLLLDAGADPTIPSVYGSPLNEAIRLRRTATARLFRRAIAEPDRTRNLHKARALLNAAIVINKAEKDVRDHDNEQERMRTRGQQMQAAVAAAPVYLKGRVQRYEAPLPVPELAPQRGRERVLATVAFVVGLEEGGVAYAGLPRELYEEVLGYMVPAWADKGPEGEDQEEDEA